MIESVITFKFIIHPYEVHNDVTFQHKSLIAINGTIPMERVLLTVQLYVESIKLLSSITIDSYSDVSKNTF